jgi:DNA replication licensing factor MCM2
MDNMHKDYKKVDELDKYENEGLDDEDHEELDARDRFAVDRLLNARDKEDMKGKDGRRIPDAFRDSEEDSEIGQMHAEDLRRNRQRG